MPNFKLLNNISPEIKNELLRYGLGATGAGIGMAGLLHYNDIINIPGIGASPFYAMASGIRGIGHLGSDAVRLTGELGATQSDLAGSTLKNIVNLDSTNFVKDVKKDLKKGGKNMLNYTFGNVEKGISSLGKGINVLQHGTRKTSSVNEQRYDLGGIVGAPLHLGATFLRGAKDFTANTIDSAAGIIATPFDIAGTILENTLALNPKAIKKNTEKTLDSSINKIVKPWSNTINKTKQSINRIKKDVIKTSSLQDYDLLLKYIKK